MQAFLPRKWLHFAGHIRRVRLMHEAGLDMLLTTAGRKLDGLIHFRPSEAGLHSIGYLTPELQASLGPAAVTTIARNAGIQMATFSTYTHQRVVPNAVFFGYARYTEAALRFGLKRFADCLRCATAPTVKTETVA